MNEERLHEELRMNEKDRERLLKAWEELDKRQLSNSQMFGKAILSLSTAGLALSLGFIKDIVDLDQATAVEILHGSWWAFVTAITAILISFPTSQCGLKKQYAQFTDEIESLNHDNERLRRESVRLHLGIALKENCEPEKNVLSELHGKEGIFSKIATMLRCFHGWLLSVDGLFWMTRWLGYLSLAAYLAAIILTVLFIILN